MTVLAIYSEDGVMQQTLRQLDDIIAELDAKGVLLERWQATEKLSGTADQDTVIAAYQNAIDVLNKRFGFESMDVVSLRPDNPQREEFRGKFLAEHTHDDFEVRFFVDGTGLFYLHIEDKVYLLLCTQGDLISVPANMTHWFDMGVAPNFKCIRLFTQSEGWIGNFTGSDIATRFPSYDQFLEVAEV